MPARPTSTGRGRTKMTLLFDPNIAYLLFMVGFVIALLAMITPGTGLLEVAGLIMLVIAGISLANQSLNLWALAIILVSIVPFWLGIRRRKKSPAFFILAVVLLALGSIFLISGEDGLAINPFAAAAASLAAGGLLWVVGRKGIEALRMRPHVDYDALRGQVGEARTDISSEGSVYVGGEEWTARSKKPIRSGAAVRILKREGLILLVEELPPAE